MDFDLKIYPSGFLGAPSVPQTQPKDLTTAAKQIFNRGYVPKQSPYTASLEVLEMFTVLLSDEKAFSTFEMKERILKIALSHFGTVKLIDWIAAQWKSPEYGDNHSRYIDETVAFVLTGKRRTINNNAWKAILTAGSNDVGKKELSDTLKSLLLGPSYLTSKRNLTIHDFIVMWCRQKDGIFDLADSLNVLYGTR